MLFSHPANGHIEKSATDLSWLWVLLFGPIYFAVKGNWRHVFLTIALSFITFGASIFVYPFFVYSINRRHYLRNGWIEVSNPKLAAPIPVPPLKRLEPTF